MYYPVVFKMFTTRDFNKLRKKIIIDYDKGFSIHCAQKVDKTITACFLGIDAYQKDNLIDKVRVEELNETDIDIFKEKLEGYVRAGWWPVGFSKTYNTIWGLVVSH